MQGPDEVAVPPAVSSRLSTREMDARIAVVELPGRDAAKTVQTQEPAPMPASVLATLETIAQYSLDGGPRDLETTRTDQSRFPPQPTTIGGNTGNFGQSNTHHSPVLSQRVEESSGMDSQQLPFVVRPRKDSLGNLASQNARAIPTFTAGTRQRGLTTSYARGQGRPLESTIPLRPSASSSDFKSYHHTGPNSRAMNPPPRRHPSHRGQRLHSSSQSDLRRDYFLAYDPGVDGQQVRTSYKSAVTAWSSSTSTGRSSVMTGDTSVSESTALGSNSMDHHEGGMSVDEAIGMYERGFHDDDVSDHEPDGISKNPRYPQRVDQQNVMRSPAVDSTMTEGSNAENFADENARSSCDGHAADLGDEKVSSPENGHAVPSVEEKRPRPRHPPPLGSFPVPSRMASERDRYGFRQESQYVSSSQYSHWNAGYTEYLERRRKKWIALLQEQNLPTDQPVRFPRRSAKVKRFVRKGIPPDWRGAAWFWYAGGHMELGRNAGLYDRLVNQAEKGEVQRNDRELIERDLHRTFPDNIRFKPDPTASSGAAGNAGGDDHRWTSGGSGGGINDDEEEEETATIRSLRRVLQAFSIHNPKIGYCQSLNFLVGLLLLFLDEEKAFWMVNIITRVYLPGTHEVNLEGANVDLAVLMTSIRESMPHIWAKVGGELDGSPSSSSTSSSSSFSRRGGRIPPTGTAAPRGWRGGGRNNEITPSTSPRLPPVFLCATAWFMSCFIGTLPTETVLRVWDSFFYEGSKTLFRIALAIFKVGEAEIRAVHDPMEIFQVVQTIPRRLVDANALLEACYKRRNGFGHLSQETIDQRRKKWRVVYARDRADGGCGGGGTV